MWIDGEYVNVKCKNRARITQHFKYEKFAVNVKNIRKITYSVLAIETFEKFQKDDILKEHTLTDIQNAINICRITYQPLNEQNIKKILSKRNYFEEIL